MIPLECKIDNNGFLYIDNFNCKRKLDYCDNPFYYKSYFLKIDSTDDYIVKCHLNRLNKREIYRMLYTFYNIGGNDLCNIDFPIGYYKENNKLRGLIVPNYNKAPSIRNVVENDNLSEFYSHSMSNKDNVLLLLSDILKILEDLYNYGIIYTDINPGNFLIYQNEVKIIDFDPQYLFKTNKDKNNHYLKMLLYNYKTLVHYVCRRLGMNYYGINNIDDESFYSVKRKIKVK